MSGGGGPTGFVSAGGKSPGSVLTATGGGNPAVEALSGAPEDGSPGAPDG